MKEGLVRDIPKLIARSVKDYIFQPGTIEEIQQFKQIQDGFRAQYECVFPDDCAPKTVVIVPSLTLDQEILAKIRGHVYYEERLLCMLMLLRMPNTHVVYVTSVPVDPVIVDYYLHLLPGITGYHARQRLTLLSCYDQEALSLTQKILERPRLIERIRKAIPHGHLAHMACFNVTEFERTLAVKLGIPIYGCDPDLYEWGTKSKSRQLFKACGLPLPDGYENLANEDEVIAALTALKERNPLLRKAVVKMNDGFSGEGNAIFSFQNALLHKGLNHWVRDQIRENLQIVAAGMDYDTFMHKFRQMGGIVEEYIEGANKQSPSVQCRISPLARVDVISTHDQLLGGETGQVFQGAYFPAANEYAPDIGRMGRTIAEFLRDRGVLGRFSVDFMSVQEEHEWKHYALEINLRKGGTTHPYLMLQFLTNGEYDEKNGLYYTANGLVRYYYSTDNLSHERYHGLTPQDLIDVAIEHSLHFDATLQEGVMFHLIGALSQYGKLGVVCIGDSPEKTKHIYRQTVDVLNRL
ncbi:MAG: peptide ligase PGM1-related protein [Chitinophagaceae bacterium]|nr:peptide ligase PGM1-related protein [Chitinophagaceae bacterium]